MPAIGLGLSPAADPHQSAKQSAWFMALALVGLLAVAVAPLPPIIFDLMIGLSLCLAALTFLVAFYVEKPAEFSSFPSLLLFVTLFRLALNVASTRLILTGSDKHAAGSVIAAFGDFAIRGNFVVGGVVFLILVIVNFVVITKGAERISEVSARFTLDSMPGKQMAIDADLGAGLITEKDARERRKVIQREADFHGAMDGASKFVRGDAIAGLLVLVVNVVGGIIIGVAQKGLSVGHAAELYTVLSIGDGLVAQIPALLVSTGAALLTTRGDDAELGTAMRGQLLARKRPLAVTAAVLFCIGLLPGMPHVLFFVLGGSAAYLATRAKTYAATAAAIAAGQADAGQPAGKGGKAKDGTGGKAEIESALPVELLGLEVGFELVSMVDASAGGELLHRVATLRKQLAGELGVIVPPLHIQDDLRLRPGGYRVLLSGVPIGTGEVHAHRVLAIDPSGMALKALTGEATVEPTFGLPAKWIAPADRLRAEAAGCTVVDAAAVVATHLTELLRRNAHELLGRREVQELLDVAGKHDSKVIEELIPHLMPTGTLIHVLRNLLREGVSIRDLRSILEALADHAHAMKNPDDLTEMVRQRLGRRITKSAVAADGTLRPLVLDPRAEQILRDGGRNPAALSRLTDEIAARARDLASRDETPVLVVSPDLRRALAGIAARHVPGLVVMSYREVDPNVRLVTRGVISAQEAA